MLRHLHRRTGASCLPSNGVVNVKVHALPIFASRQPDLCTRSSFFSTRQNGYPGPFSIPISALSSFRMHSGTDFALAFGRNKAQSRNYAQEAYNTLEEDNEQEDKPVKPVRTWELVSRKTYAPRGSIPSTSRPVQARLLKSDVEEAGSEVKGNEVRMDQVALENAKGDTSGRKNRERSANQGTSKSARPAVNKSSVSYPASPPERSPSANNQRSSRTTSKPATCNRSHQDDIREIKEISDAHDRQPENSMSWSADGSGQVVREGKGVLEDAGRDMVDRRNRKRVANQGSEGNHSRTVAKSLLTSRDGPPATRSPNIASQKTAKSTPTRNRSLDDAFALPESVDPDEIGQVEDISMEHAQLAFGPELTATSDDAYVDAPADLFALSDFAEVEEDDLMQHLHGVEEYAAEQTESIKQGIKDVGGRAARGTKENPLKGDLDPLEVDMMGIDKLAGGEEQLLFFTDEELEALMGAARARNGDDKVTGIDLVDLPRTVTRRVKSKLVPARMDVASPSAPLQEDRWAPPTLSIEDSGARYGRDSNGNPTPSRFKWWERATSRHAASLYNAKRIMIMRKSLPILRMTTKDYWFRPLKSYMENFVPLIEAEQAHEEKVIRERLDANGVEKLVMEGYCLNELTARQDSGKQAGRPTYTFSFAGRGGTRRFAWNRFNPGTCIIISPSGEKANPVKKNQSRGGKGSNTYNTGSVVSKTYGSVKVSFDEPLHAVELSQTWRLDIWTSDIVMRRAKEALATLHYDPVAIDRHGVVEPKPIPLTVEQAEVDANQALEGKSAPKATLNQLILPGTALRHVLLDDFIPHDPSVLRPARLDGPGVFADNELIQSWCRRQLVQGREPIEVEGDPELTLNTSQRRAIATMLSSNISLIQGPPGTGKTRTIIEMLRLLKVHWEVPQPILVSAYTNNAVDNLAEGMSKRGLKVLRYGSRSRIRDDLEKLTLDWYLERHPDKDEMQKLKGLTYNLPKDHPHREAYRRRLFGLERRMVTDILLSVDVVCATCISSRGRLLEVVDFPVVFIDEASMATEPNAVIPLTKGCQHAALIGDHKQLPPLVISAKAAEGKLQTSLFERLINNGKIPSVMLDTQYRMHPSISAFPSKEFYGSKLRDGTIDKEGKVLAGLEPPQGILFQNDVTGKQRTVTFIHHTKPDFARAKSIVNEGEAAIIHTVVLQLLKENPKLFGSDIGIIAPYAGQISRIENEIKHNTRRRRQSFEYLGEERSWELDNIEVHTVDGFEGREKRVILFSTTRSNEGNWIGFLDDWRRMNVGLTRAKSGLIIVGNSNTLENARSNLTTDPEATAGTVYWRNLIRDLREANAIESYDIENVAPTTLESEKESASIAMQEVEQEETEPAAASVSL